MAEIRRPFAHLALLAIALASAASLTACGHPASEGECREIMARIFELELAMQNVTEPTEVAKRRKELEEQIAGGKSGAYQGCVGKRITDKAMECIRKAKTSDEITEGCLK